MKKIWMKLSIGLILAVYFFMGHDAAEAQEIYNIVILHSYHYGYEWTDKQNNGIYNILKKELPDSNIYVEYLDWKRFPNETVMDDQYALLQDKYKGMQVQLIMTTDDQALKYALAHRETIFNDAPIVFSGIIESGAEELIGDEKNITGVYSKMDPSSAINLMRSLQPDVKKLYVINDITESGRRTAGEVYDALEAMGLNNQYEVVSLEQYAFSQLLEMAPQFEADSAVFFVSYSYSTDGLVLPSKTYCEQFAQVCPVPLYSIDEFYLGNGILGGAFQSGILHGEKSAQLGVSILRGTEADSIEPVGKSTSYTAVDEDVMEKFSFDSGQLPENTTIINEHFSFFRTYRTLVLITAGIVFGLLIFVMVLSYFIRQLRLSKVEILSQKNRLQALNEQLTGSEEELQAQNEELLNYQDHLKYEAQHDALTKLPNRIALEAFVDQGLQEAMESGDVFGVFFVDLDNFKFINNTYGHHIGDEILTSVAGRLETLTELEFVSRIGGDEFVVIKFFKNDRQEEISSVLYKIGNCFSKPYAIYNEQIHVTASIGYSLFPEDGKRFDDLIVQADMAMYQAKKAGKSTARSYQKEMRSALENDLILVAKLKDALTMNEFYLEFQPLVDPKANHIKGFEALLRWKNKDYGVVPPSKFITLAENSGIIIPIGYYVIKKALEFAVMVKPHIKNPFIISINVSVVQFYDEDFIDQIIKMIHQSGIDLTYVQIEITESLMIDVFEEISEKITRLRREGVSVSLDDFGTGYSSLAYLHKLPINQIKIDKMFIDNIEDADSEVALIDATVLLARHMNIGMIAEGVETQMQLDFLMKKGDFIIQGYYYSKPLPAEKALEYVQSFNMGEIPVKS